MHSLSRLAHLRSLSAAFVALAALAAPAAGQLVGPQPLTRTQFGLGFVANAPDALLGGSAYLILPTAGGIGLYVDAKFDNANPSGELGFDARYTARQVAGDLGGVFVKREASWRSLNAALVRPLTPSLMVYVGGGIATASYYDLFANVPLDVDAGHGGVVWAESPEDDETLGNLMFGVMLRMTSRFTTQFGYETRPKGVTAGVSLRLPAW